MRKVSFLVAATGALVSACGATDEPARAVGETASDRIELSADSPEPIIEIAVAEGTAVDAGQVVVRQDPARAAASLATAEADLAQARARLAELVRGPRNERIVAARANVSGAREQVAYQEADYERVQEVYAKDLATAALRDQAAASLDAARSRLEVFEAELEELLAGTTIEELDQAESAVAAAAARRDAAEVTLERLTLRAPVAGVADTRLFDVGERPAAGQPVMILLGGEQPYARVYVTEAQRAGVTPGSRARVHVDGIDAPHEGRVRWVASEAAFTPYYALTERDRGRLSYEAKVDILGLDSRLPDGVPVEVEFLDGGVDGRP